MSAHPVIDLRSDTVTRPTAAMRRAMADAEVGDDVFGDDPTVNRLQAEVAELLGKEAALFVPSGTMGNQLAVRSQSRPGDQVVLEAGAHIYRYEAGAPAVLSGVQLTCVAAPGGQLAWPQVAAALNPDNVHCPPPALVCLENTHNNAGGRILPQARVAEIGREAHARGLRVHLDGARLWHVHVATGLALAELAAPVDTVSVCFSKALGAPVGSVLAGDRATVAAAYRFRKLLGGGMRQVGVLAAACRHALAHHLARLADDHAHAAALAAGLDHPALSVNHPVETNIVIIDVAGDGGDVRLLAHLAAHGVLGVGFGPGRVRLIPHLETTDAHVARVGEVLNAFPEGRVKIVIIGAGAVGFQLARTISRREHDVILVDRDQELLDKVAEHLDCRFVTGNGVSPGVLEQIGMRDCDLFAAVTNRDEINIIACQTAHALGAKVKVARVRDEDYYQNHRLLLDGIDLAINPDHEAVHAIREILFQTGATEVHEFAGGKVRIIGARVERESRVAGRTLAEINRELGSSIALVTTIVRGDRTLIPRGDTVIEADDQVFMAGVRRVVDRSLIHFRAGDRRLSKVMIVGANAMGRELARDLMTAGVKVKIIDRNEEKCRLASETLRHALVLHGEVSDSDLLASEGVSEMDGFVSVSSDEETNIMGCLLARHLGAARTVCLVDRPDYVPLLPLLGVDAAVSPRLSTSAWIASFVKRGAVVSAESLGYSGAEILQLRVGERCGWLGRKLMDLEFPRDAVIGAVLKRGVVNTPGGDTVLQAGDEVVVFALPGGVEAVEEFFAGGDA